MLSQERVDNLKLDVKIICFCLCCLSEGIDSFQAADNSAYFKLVGQDPLLSSDLIYTKRTTVWAVEAHCISQLHLLPKAAARKSIKCQAGFCKAADSDIQYNVGIHSIYHSSDAHCKLAHSSVAETN